jgi:hypothetical protein
MARKKSSGPIEQILEQLREKQQLLGRRRPDVVRLQEINRGLDQLRGRVRPKRPSVAAGGKRQYRDVSLLE